MYSFPRMLSKVTNDITVAAGKIGLSQPHILTTRTKQVLNICAVLTASLLPVLKAIRLTIVFSCTPRALSSITSLRSTMKVTSNLFVLLCIGTVAMPVINASLNGFGLNKRSAATKHSLQRQDAFDFAAQQSHRGLKSATAIALLSERSAAAKRAAKNQKAVEVAVHQQHRSLQGDLQLDDATCEIFLTAIYGPNSGCPCTAEEPTMECIDFIAANCLLCDTIQSEEACLVSDFEATLAAFPETGSSYADCLTYRSGPFANDTICEIENFSDNTCTFTINETECTSCTVVACDGETDYDIDCSNIIAGETWNLCTDDIPDTSPFIAFGSNDRFGEFTCANGGGISEDTSVEAGVGESNGSNPGDESLGGTDSGDGGDTSGGVAASSHVFSLVGIIIVTCFW
jgi:hypothetical protein